MLLALAGRAGPRRRVRLAQRAGADHHDLRARTQAQQGLRRLRDDVRPRRRRRPAARRLADRQRPDGLRYDVHGWRLTFFINVPIGIAAALAAPRLLVESDRHAGHLDVPGAVTATAGLLSLVFGITRAGDRTLRLERHLDPGRARASASCCSRSSRCSSAATPQPLLPGRILANRDRARGVRHDDADPRRDVHDVLLPHPGAAERHGREPDAHRPDVPAVQRRDDHRGRRQVSKLVQQRRPRQARRHRRGRSRRSRCSASAGCRTTTRCPASASTSTTGPHVFPFIVLMPIGMALVFIPTTMSVLHGVSPRDSRHRLRRAQHDAAGRRRARPGDAEHDRVQRQSDKVTELCGDLAQRGPSAARPTRRCSA